MSNFSFSKVLIENLPWSSLLSDFWSSLKSFYFKLNNKGIYDVLEHSVLLKIHDVYGKKASYHKQQVVQYKQNNVIAFHDQAWGDGKILIDYKCLPGKAVDRYRLGHKYLTLISLREIRNRSDKDKIDIQWKMENCFKTTIEGWTTSISHHTKQVTIVINFPKNRSPKKIWFIEINRKKQSTLSLKDHLHQNSSGKWVFQKIIKDPRLYEDYTIRWYW